MQELFEKNFDSLNKRVSYILSEITDTIPIIAQNLGVNRNTISTYKKGKGDLKGVAIEGLVKYYKVNPVWILTGSGPVYNKDIGTIQEPEPIYGTQSENKSASDTPNLTKVVVEHHDIIRRFQDAEKAKEFNEFLVDIEQEDPEGYDELYREAKAVAKTIRRLKKKEDAEDSLQNKKSV